MALEFDERRLLVPGVHDATMEIVQQHFGQFQRSDRRLTLFAKLKEYIEALKKAECGQCVILDGSFVMACVDEPDDIDIVLVLPKDWDKEADLKPFIYNLVSKKAVKKTYGIDVFMCVAYSPEEAAWIEFFGRVNLKWREKYGWPPESRKGILRIAP